MITRHVSLDDDHVKKMEPYLEIHDGNFGRALKEIIIQSEKYSSRMNSSAIDNSLLEWMLDESEGMLLPDSVLDEIIDPGLLSSMTKLEAFLKRRFVELGWHVELSMRYDIDRFPSEVLIETRGAPQKIKFAACMISHYIVKNSLEQAPLGIKYVININNCMKVELSKSNKKEAQRSLITFFGELDEAIKTIKSRPAFWKEIIHRHLSSNYNMVTLHRNYLEDLFADKIPAGEIMIETLARRPLQEIPLKEMLPLIKHVYESSRIADRVDIDKDTIIVSHNYRNKDAAEKLKKSLVMLMESNGHLYYAKSAASIIVLTHRPDVGIKINEIVSKLKTSKSRVDQEMIMFMAFLEGLKEMPDIPLSLTALGRRIGKTLMQEYERENSVRNWDLETFQKALEMVDSRIHRVSEWKLDGKNLLYTVRKCHIVAEGNTFDTYVCHTAREAFKGALSYAFGNRADLKINKLLTHGDNLCEVVVRIL